MDPVLGRLARLDARTGLAALRLVCLGPGPGLPGDWNGRLAPSHEFIFHFNRQPRKPNKTVESKHAGETLGGGGLRGADGTVHRKTGYGNAIQSHRIPDSVFRIMRHKGGLGAAGSHPAVFPVALVEAVLEAFTDPGDLVFEPFCGSGAADRCGTLGAALLCGGTGPGLLRRGRAEVGDGDGAEGQPRLTSWPELANVRPEGEWERPAAFAT